MSSQDNIRDLDADDTDGEEATDVRGDPPEEPGSAERDELTTSDSNVGSDVDTDQSAAYDSAPSSGEGEPLEPDAPTAAESDSDNTPVDPGTLGNASINARPTPEPDSTASESSSNSDTDPGADQGQHANAGNDDSPTELTSEEEPQLAQLPTTGGRMAGLGQPTATLTANPLPARHSSRPTTMGPDGSGPDPDNH